MQSRIPHRTRRHALQRTLAATSLVALACFAGCVVAPVRPRFVGEVVLTPPPAPRVEVIGVAPFPGYVWIGGYWNWVGGQHVWVAGGWEAPRAGHYWEPHTWVHTGNGWHLREGHWVRR